MPASMIASRSNSPRSSSTTSTSCSTSSRAIASPLSTKRCSRMAYAANRQHPGCEIRERRPGIPRRPLRRRAGPRRILHPRREEPAQGVHPRAGPVLAYQFAFQPVTPTPGAKHAFARIVVSTTPLPSALRYVPPAKAGCVSSGVQGGYGNVIELEHGSGVVTVYGHLSRFATHLQPRPAGRAGQGHWLCRHDRPCYRARTCTTNIAFGAYTRTRRPSRCRTRSRSRRTKRDRSSPPRPTWSTCWICPPDQPSSAR